MKLPSLFSGKQQARTVIFIIVIFTALIAYISFVLAILASLFILLQLVNKTKYKKNARPKSYLGFTFIALPLIISVLIDAKLDISMFDTFVIEKIGLLSIKILFGILILLFFLVYSSAIQYVRLTTIVFLPLFLLLSSFDNIVPINESNIIYATYITSFFGLFLLLWFLTRDFFGYYIIQQWTSIRKIYFSPFVLIGSILLYGIMMNANMLFICMIAQLFLFNYWINILEQNRRIDCPKCDMVGKITTKMKKEKWYIQGYINTTETKVCPTCHGAKFIYRQGRENILAFSSPEKQTDSTS